MAYGMSCQTGRQICRLRPQKNPYLLHASRSFPVSFRYAPCLFHRWCNVVDRADSAAATKGALSTESMFVQTTSDSRAKALQHASTEYKLLSAKLSFLKQGNHWGILRAYDAPMRARVFRELNLERALCMQPKAMRRFLQQVPKQSTEDLAFEWRRIA